MRDYKKPVILLGHGCKASGAKLDAVMELGVPVLTSWQAADLVDNYLPNYFGRPGIYGQRCANRILYEADMILAIGNRCATWEIGHDGFRPEQQLALVEIDETEARKFERHVEWINKDAAEWINSGWAIMNSESWMRRCREWKERWPWTQSEELSNGYPDIYRFMARLQAFLKPDQIITLDVGAAVCPAYQVLKFKPPQRIITSGGLGEMGCGMPAAIGASFAHNEGEVLCLCGDGGMMLNLHAMQTIAHHRLPVKIIVFANDGYAMIKRTQLNLGMKYRGVDKASGVSMPDFVQLAQAMEFEVGEIHTWHDFDKTIPQFFSTVEPALLQVHIDPEQVFLKLQPIVERDGSVSAPKFWDLSPRVPYDAKSRLHETVAS